MAQVVVPTAAPAHSWGEGGFCPPQHCPVLNIWENQSRTVSTTLYVVFSLTRKSQMESFPPSSVRTEFSSREWGDSLETLDSHSLPQISQNLAMVGSTFSPLDEA